MQDLKTYLLSLIDPSSGFSLDELDALKGISQNQNQLQIELCFPFANGKFLERLPVEILAQIEQIAGKKISWEISHQIEPLKAGRKMPNLAKVKQIVAISSGKGGVGKSTTAVNLALALAQEGAKVALLDADIHGPSLPLMLGCEGKTPPLPDGKQMMMPISAHGIVVNSIGFLVSAEEATIWRGPMAAGILQQLLRDTIWGEVDYLIVDMPPGTGDIPLTLAQAVPLSAAVVVTTPQTIALADAVKGIAMYNKLNVPVAGVVENMSFHICRNCGEHEYLFGKDGGQRIADHYEVLLLGALPLDKQIGDDVENGVPTVVADPTSELAIAYNQTAQAMAVQLWLQSLLADQPVEIEIAND